MAFFAMDPAFSFEVASPVDQGALVVYGLASFFLVFRISKRHEIFEGVPAHGFRRPERAPETAISDLLDRAVAEAGCGDSEIDIDPGLRAARSPEAMGALFATIMRAGAPRIAPIRITVYGADLPGQKRIWLALQYKLLPDEPHALQIGRHADRCQTLETPHDADCGVTWFDNDFERVFQISLPYTDC